MPAEMESDIQIKASNGQVSVDEAQGIVECFVAAIGNKDSVGDIIQPGAFSGSLQRRKPRVVWGHNWNDPIGKVIDIQEVGPSDPRLPEKMKSGGVGGLYARVQFNLGSDKGREAFASVAFFGGDQEWSIGYKTINATFDPVRQANILHEVELYECSPVLHGANQLTGTISVKGADAALMEHEETHTQMQDDFEFEFDEKDGMLAMMPVEAPRTEGLSDQHDRKLELELMSRSPQPIKLVSATNGVAIFQVQRSDNGPAMYRVHYHHHPDCGFMLGRPERVMPQMVYAPIQPSHKPSTIRMKPQVDPTQRYQHDPQDTVMPRIMRIVQKLNDGEEKADELIISCRMEEAFATKSLLDPIIDYHGAIAEVTEEGIIIKSGATPDFIKAVETATKALGRRLGRGFPGGGGGLGKVRRAGRALQGFNPDAVDADLDMLVQEGTPWERPALPGKPDLPDLLPRRTRTRYDADRRRVSPGLRSTRDRDIGSTRMPSELPDDRPEGVGMGDRPPSKQRIGDMSRTEYEAFRLAEAQKIIDAYGIQDVSDPLYPHPALTEFSNFDHTELVPISFFEDMPGNFNDDVSVARAGEMRDFELNAPIIMEKLDELTEDIKQNGIANALIVRYNPRTGDVRLDEGNHRLAAAQRLGLSVVPVRMLRGTGDRERREGISGPRKLIPSAQTNVRDEPVDLQGQYLGESFRPSSVGVPSEKASPEIRRLQMLVAARGGSRAQEHRRRERREGEYLGFHGIPLPESLRREGPASRSTRVDLRASEITDRLDLGKRRRRRGDGGVAAVGDNVIWNRQEDRKLESQRIAELRGSGFGEHEIAHLMNPSQEARGGLESNNFTRQSAYNNLRTFIEIREELLDWLNEHPDFDPHLPEVNANGIAQIGTVDLSDIDDIDAWDALYTDFLNIHNKYTGMLEQFQEKNRLYEEAIEARTDIGKELRHLDKQLNKHIDYLSDHLQYELTDDEIRELLKEGDLNGFMSHFTPEFVAGRGERATPGGTFDLSDEAQTHLGWEEEVRSDWDGALEVLGELKAAEQKQYGIESDVSRHHENGHSDVLAAAEVVNRLPLDTRVESSADIGHERSLYVGALGLKKPTFDDRGSLRSETTGRGLGPNREIDPSNKYSRTPSSAVSHLQYDGGEEELVVTFSSGQTYVYGGIDADMADRLEKAGSKGKAINELKTVAEYVIKPDGEVDGNPRTLSAKIEHTKNRLSRTRDLSATEHELLDIVDGAVGQRPIKDPAERKKVIRDVHKLADEMAEDHEPYAAKLLRDAAAAIRDNPGRRINAHHSGKMDVTLSDDEIGEIRDGLKSSKSRIAGHPNIEHGMNLYDEKLSAATNGRISLDTAEYNNILDAYSRLDLIDPDSYFKPGRDVLEITARADGGKWASPNVAKAKQRPDLPTGFASRRPNNGAPADITPRLQGDMVHWARQQGGFRVVQELVRRHDRDREQLSTRDWVRLHDYYANHSPAGRGMPLYGQRRGLRSETGDKPRKRAPGAGRKVGEDQMTGKFAGRHWEKPDGWDEMSTEEQVGELVTNHNPDDKSKPAGERLRRVDYERIRSELEQREQRERERRDPEERRERMREDRAARRAERMALAKEREATKPAPKGAKKTVDDGDEKEAARERREGVLKALGRYIESKRNSVRKAVDDDRADPTHGEFWDSLQDILYSPEEDNDYKLSLMEALAQRVDDYLDDSLGADLTNDESSSIELANETRDRLKEILASHADDKFIERGDGTDDLEREAAEWAGGKLAGGGDDPDDPTAQVRETFDAPGEGLASRTSPRTERGGGLQSEGSERPLLPRPERGAAYDPLKQGLEGVTEGLLDLFDPDRKKKKPPPKRERPTIPMKKPEAEDAEGLASRSDRAEGRETRRLAASMERGERSRTRRAKQRAKQKKKYVDDLGKSYRENIKRREQGKPKKPTKYTREEQEKLKLFFPEVVSRDVEPGYPGQIRTPNATREQRGLASQRTSFDGRSSFFKIVYDSLDKEIAAAERNKDSDTAQSLKKLKKSFEYFNSRSIQYGPKHPKQTDSGTVQIDNEALPDIIEALFKVIDRQISRGRGVETDTEREEALVSYLRSIMDSAGVSPEVDSMEAIRIAALTHFIEMLSEGAMELL